MTQEDKELLLIDLCARLPYGVKFQGEDSNVYTLDAANYFAFQVEDVVFKPYLRPMSSMAEEEKYTYRHMLGATLNSEGESIMFVYVEDFPTVIDWLNEHHFDYRGLLEKGLALEAPDGMYNADTEEEEVKVEIPNTVEEALVILDKIVSEEDKEYIKKRGAISVHLTLGMWIRNNWGLWENSDFYKYLHEKTGLTHPDDMSNYIIEEFIKWKLGK